MSPIVLPVHPPTQCARRWPPCAVRDQRARDVAHSHRLVAFSVHHALRNERRLHRLLPRRDPRSSPTAPPPSLAHTARLAQSAPRTPSLALPAPCPCVPIHVCEASLCLFADVALALRITGGPAAVHARAPRHQRWCARWIERRQSMTPCANLLCASGQA